MVLREERWLPKVYGKYVTNGDQDVTFGAIIAGLYVAYVACRHGRQARRAPGKPTSNPDFALRAPAGTRGRAMGCRGRADLGHKEP